MLGMKTRWIRFREIEGFSLQARLLSLNEFLGWFLVLEYRVRAIRHLGILHCIYFKPKGNTGKIYQQSIKEDYRDFSQ